MDLHEWNEQITKIAAELTHKYTLKFNRGKPINLIKDIVPEWKDLSGKSYT